MFTYNPILTLIILVIFGCEFRILPYTLNIPLIPLNTLMEYSNDTYATNFSQCLSFDPLSPNVANFEKSSTPTSLLFSGNAYDPLYMLKIEYIFE